MICELSLNTSINNGYANWGYDKTVLINSCVLFNSYQNVMFVNYFTFYHMYHLYFCTSISIVYVAVCIND